MRPSARQSAAIIGARAKPPRPAMEFRPEPLPADFDPTAFQLETPLVRATIKLLLAVGIPAWRNNSGAVLLDATDTNPGRFVQFGAKGSADVLGVLTVRYRHGDAIELTTGRFLAIECKVKKRKATREQLAFGAMIERAGGLYLILRHNTDGLLDALREAGWKG